jgi:hypothetical protein
MPEIEQFAPAGQSSLRILMYQTLFGVIVPTVDVALESPVVTNCMDEPNTPVRNTRALGPKSLQVCESVTVRFANVLESSCVKVRFGIFVFPIVVSFAPTVILITSELAPTISVYGKFFE